MSPTKSKMMDKLYGETLANTVYARCQELGENFNDLVQNVVYDVFWAKPGLALKEKSLITVISLITLNKEEQLQIHLKGYFHQGGTTEDIANILTYMANAKYITSADKALSILNAVANENNAKHHAAGISLNINSRDKGLIDLAAHIALGNNSQTEICMRILLENKILSAIDIENIMLHQIVYCGFPCAMNGYAVLKACSSKP